MRYISFTIIAAVFLCNMANAQEKWDLRKIVDYAVANNISIKQAEVQASISGLNYRMLNSILLHRVILEQVFNCKRVLIFLTGLAKETPYYQTSGNMKPQKPVLIN
jgi:hypothetical protein